MQELQLLRRQFCIEEIDTSQVGARTGETRDETEPHGIFGDDEYERDCGGCRFCSKYGGSTSAGEYHGDVPANEIRHQLGNSIELIFRPAVDDRGIVAFHVAGFGEAPPNPRRRSDNASGERESRKPMTGVVGCCARAASGHAAAAAAPLSSEMNARRFRMISAFAEPSCAGLTRASIFLRRRMDCRVKPGNDEMSGPLTRLPRRHGRARYRAP